MKMFCLKCNSDLHFLLSPVCAVCSSKINFNLSTPSMNSLNLQSDENSNSDKSMENYENLIESTMRDLDEVGEEINSYRVLSQRNNMSDELYNNPQKKSSDLNLQDLLQEIISEKHTRTNLIDEIFHLNENNLIDLRSPRFLVVPSNVNAIGAEMNTYRVLSQRNETSNESSSDRFNKRNNRLKDLFHEKISEETELEKLKESSPIPCPISQCKKLFFSLQFSQHIYDAHINVPVEIVTPGQHKKIYFNIENQQPLGLNKCAMLYLVKGKITDFIKGLDTRFSSYLPVVLMSTQIGIGQLLSDNWDVKDDEPKIVLFWLTGIAPENDDIYVNLSSHSKNGLVAEKSGKLYDAKMDQNYKSIYDSGMCLILTEDDLKNSKDDENYLNLHVTIYLINK